jgi:hypothetical protein
MSAKRKPGRPDTHLSEHAVSFRLSHAMVAQMKQAAGAEKLTATEWLRRAIDDALRARRAT